MPDDQTTQPTQATRQDVLMSEMLRQFHGCEAFPPSPPIPSNLWRIRRSTIMSGAQTLRTCLQINTPSSRQSSTTFSTPPIPAHRILDGIGGNPAQRNYSTVSSVQTTTSLSHRLDLSNTSSWMEPRPVSVQSRRFQLFMAGATHDAARAERHACHHLGAMNLADHKSSLQLSITTSRTVTKAGLLEYR